MLRTIERAPEATMTNARIGLQLPQITRAAAAAAAEWKGRGDKLAADEAAVTAMHEALGRSKISCQVAIGEGEKDEAPMLAHGYVYGNREPLFDLAADPVEGTTRLSKGEPGSMSVIALAGHGDMPKWNGIPYMEKLFVGPELSDLMSSGHIGLHLSPGENLRLMAKALGKRTQDLSVAVLNRENRNGGILKAARLRGYHLMPLPSGDLFPAMQTCDDEKSRGVDVLYGSGGAPEGVLAAAYVAIMGGNGQVRWHPQTPEQARIAEELEIKDKVLSLEELVGRGALYFAATGITKSPVRRDGDPPTLTGSQNIDGHWYPGTSVAVWRPETKNPNRTYALAPSRYGTLAQG